MVHPSKLSVGQRVTIKKSCLTYGGHDAIVIAAHPDSAIVKLEVLSKLPQENAIAQLNFACSAIRNPNIRKNVRYVVTIGDVHTRQEQGVALTLGRGIKLAREYWESGNQEYRIDLWRERKTRRELVSRHVLTFYAADDPGPEVIETWSSL